MAKLSTKNEKPFFNFDTKKLISFLFFSTGSRALRHLIDGNYNTNIVKILIKKKIIVSLSE